MFALVSSGTIGVVFSLQIDLCTLCNRICTPLRTGRPARDRSICAAVHDIVADMCVGLLYLSLAFAQTAAVPVRLYPVDDSARDPGFHSYVRKLQAVVDRRDAAGLRKLVDTRDVVVGAGKEDKGWLKFVERWRPEDRANGPLWSALLELLSFGFVQEHPRLFLSPYLVWRFPRDLPVRAPLVVTRDNAPLRNAPSPRAGTVALLSFDIVERLAPQKTDGLAPWVYVRTLDGKTGYLNANDARSPMMPRAQFGMRDGRWLLIALEGPEQ